MDREIDKAVATRRREIEDSFELRVQSREKRIAEIKDELAEAREAYRTEKSDKKLIEGKLSWWRGLSQWLVVLLAAAVTYNIFVILNQ